MRKNNDEFIDEIYNRAHKEKRQIRARRKKLLVSSVAACFVLVITAIPRIMNPGQEPLWNRVGHNGGNLFMENEGSADSEAGNTDRNTEVSDYETGNTDKNTEISDYETGNTDQNTEVAEECKLSTQVVPLMSHVTAQKVEGISVNETFSRHQIDLAVSLFKNAIAQEASENTLISPLSIELALSMTMNGAAGDTKAEMERLLTGTIGAENMNRYLKSYVNSLSSKDKYKLQIANSIWFRDTEDLVVEQDFLQTNANYYGADIYQSPFNEQTVTDINQWVSYKTDGMIEKLIGKIDDKVMMYLINAVMFDAEWSVPYTKDQVHERPFTTFDGNRDQVEMMYSEEGFYLENHQVTGFRKNYYGNQYSFVALLPKEEGKEAYDSFLDSLTGEKLEELLAGEISATVNAGLPKFSYDYSLSMHQMLSSMGMPTAFVPLVADFRDMARVKVNGNWESLYISNVLHKTFISVAEKGTRAGAVTGVEMSAPESAGPEKVYSVILDRPFIYMIIDNETRLPIFMGTLTDLKE